MSTVSLSEAFWRSGGEAPKSVFRDLMSSTGALVDGRVQLATLTSGRSALVAPKIRVLGVVRL